MDQIILEEPVHSPGNNGPSTQNHKNDAGNNQEGYHMTVCSPLPEGVKCSPVHPPEGGLLQGGGDKLDWINLV